MFRDDNDAFAHVQPRMYSVCGKEMYQLSASGKIPDAAGGGGLTVSSQGWVKK